MNKRYKIGDELDVEIKKIVPNGYGLAFADNLTIFVPLSVAGDKLRVRIYQLKGKVAFTEIIEILQPSPDRIEPECGYFGICGGCNFQQMPYQLQIDTKVEILRDCLVRLGKFDFTGEISVIGSPRPFNYRSRAQWHAEKRPRKLGYFRRNSDDIIDIEKCPILTGDLQTAFSDLRKTLEWDDFGNHPIRIEAAAAADGSVSMYSDEIIEPTREIAYAGNGRSYLYNANVFFQGNLELIEDLILLATSGGEGVRALDLYCGVGLFTLPLAEQFQTVIGVEENSRAVDFAEKNVAHASLTNVTFHRESTSEFLSQQDGATPDFVLLDPPRSGTEKGVIESIIRLGPKQISYISCEPSILARDLSAFAANGYEIDSLAVIDLFPQTHHVETVARLKKIRPVTEI